MCNNYSTSIAKCMKIFNGILLIIVLLIIPTHSGAFLTSTTTTTITTTTTTPTVTTTSFQWMRCRKQFKMEQVSYWENRHTSHHQHHFRKYRHSILYPKMSFGDSFTNHNNNNNNNDDDTILIRTTTTVSSNDEYAYLTKVRECIQELSDVEGIDYVKEWNDSIQIIISTLMNDQTTRTTYRIEQIESSLAMAWNWKRYVIITSPIARKFIQTIQPNSTMILSSIQWLQQANELQLSNEIILQGIIKSPETYLLRPQISYNKAITVAPKPYTNNVVTFRELIQQYPSALQYTYNCIDTGCQSECGHCWVSFPYISNGR